MSAVTEPTGTEPTAFGVGQRRVDDRLDLRDPRVRGDELRRERGLAALCRSGATRRGTFFWVCATTSSVVGSNVSTTLPTYSP